LLPLSLGFCIYALHIFLLRADCIKMCIPGWWDDPSGQQNLRIPRGYTAEAKGTRTTKRGQGGCWQLRIAVAT
jgi:hypothetical protein